MVPQPFFKEKMNYLKILSLIATILMMAMFLISFLLPNVSEEIFILLALYNLICYFYYLLDEKIKELKELIKKDEK